MSYSRRQLEVFGEPFGDSATRKEAGRIVYGSGGGGGGGGTSVQVTDLPDWAKPYAQETLERTSALSKAPYQTYDQPRTAGFSPMQQKAQESAFKMGPSGQIGAGTGLATAAGLMGLGANYQPGYFGNQFRAPQQYQPSQFGMMSAQAPDLQQFQMGPAERVSAGQYGAPEMQAAQTQFRPDLQQFQMGPAERASTQSFTQPGSAEAYMSPFMQNVVDKQTREAERQAGLAAKQERAASIQRGAFGGGRTAVREAAAARDLAQLKSDIYGTGQQASFQNAQQQFNAEQQARMQAQLANQQAGLTVGGQNLAANLGVQQLGTQTGMQAALANLNNQQQAAVQNQAAQLQTQGMSAQQAMQAALANQQAGLTTGQQNLAAQLGVQQLGSGQNMQSQLANQQAYQNMLQQREASRQFGYGQQMTAAQQRAQFGQAANQLAEQSRQFGAGYGQQGINTALQAAGQLGNLGQAEFGQNKDIIGLQSQLGGQQQAQRQQDLTMAYQDYLNEKNEPYRQLGFMSDMIRGLPLGQQTTRQVYEAPGSALGQIAGLGVGLGGMSRFGQMFDSGGEVKEYADGGSVTSDYKVDNILDNLSDAQLQQARMTALNGQDQRRLQMIDEEMAERASLRSGLGSAFNTLPEETQESVTEMASGGIVAFAGPTEDNNYSLVQDPQFGAGLSAEALSGDRARVEALKARRAAEEERKRLEFLRTAAPEVYERRMAERPAAPVASRQEPARTAPSAPPRREISLPPARPSRSESSSTVTRQNATEAVQTIANAAKIEIPKDETRTLSKTLFDELMSKSDEERKEFKAELQNAKNRAKEIEARGIGEAMMKFGFGMAAAASKPGRRQGLAGVLESAAAASPLLSESMAENTKLQQAAQDNYTKLRMENSRYQSALEQGNMQLAANIAAGISQRKLTEADLQQKIAQSDRTANLEQQKLGLEERRLAIAQSQAGRPSSSLELAYNIISRDPNNANKSPTELVELAAKSAAAASMSRADQTADLNRAALVEKVKKANPMYGVLEAQLSLAKTPEDQVAIRRKLEEIEKRALGSIIGGGGVGSRQNSGWSIEPVAGAR
jgi:hypothetical protein